MRGVLQALVGTLSVEDMKAPLGHQPVEPEEEEGGSSSVNACSLGLIVASDGSTRYSRLCDYVANMTTLSQACQLH